MRFHRESMVLCFAVLCFAASGLSAKPQDDGKPKRLDQFDDIDPSVLNVDVPSLLHIRTDEDVARVRTELIAFIWKNDGQLPNASDVVRAAADLPPPLAMCPATCETLTIEMTNGFKSVVHHFQPKKPTRKLALFHQGHDDNVWSGGGAETVTFLLDRGYAVMVFQMPLFGDNKPFAPAGVGSHNAMEQLVARDLEPIRYFVEPVAVALNYSAKQFAHDDVVMIGLSGGGWTTTLYAALDPRVRLSFPVAGTLPDYLRVGRTGDKGDWEQYYPALYRIANYLDLYVMGASGPGRKQRQVLNKFDSCCFWGVGYRTYEKHVQEAVGESGAGGFDVYLDESHRSHLVSQDTLKRAIGPLLEEARTRPLVKTTHVYKTVGDVKVEADVYRPDAEENRPVVVWIHGGALIVGSRSQVPKQILELCTRDRFVLVSLDYRLAPEVKLPEIAVDLQDAFRWLHEQGPMLFGADPQRIVVTGGSAGGFLTMLSGAIVTPRPTALVAYWGYGDIDGDWTRSASTHHGESVPRDEALAAVGKRVLTNTDDPAEGKARCGYYRYLRQTGGWSLGVTGVDAAKEPGRLDAFCPVKQITSVYPPILMIHGTEDTDVPYACSVDMARELTRHGVKHELLTVVGAEHGLRDGDPGKVAEANTRAIEFIREQLTGN